MPRNAARHNPRQPFSRVEVMTAAGLGIGVVGWAVLLTRKQPEPIDCTQCPVQPPGTAVDGDPIGVL